MKKKALALVFILGLSASLAMAQGRRNGSGWWPAGTWRRTRCSATGDRSDRRSGE